MKRLVSASMLLFCLVGCSIKADRSECPCHISVSVSGGAEGVATMTAWNQKEIISKDVLMSEGGAECDFHIQRGHVLLSAFSGCRQCMLDGTGLIVEEGKEMDEIFAWRDDVTSYSESLEVKGKMHKQFALIHLFLVDENWTDENELKVTGNVKGLDMSTLKPIPGTFYTCLSPVLGSYYRVCVPRQIDNSLGIENVKTGDSFPLGKFIALSQYDWKSEDLDDIEVLLDFKNRIVEVQVKQWDGEKIFEYEI